VSWDAPLERRRRTRALMLVAGICATLAWAVFAFGGVYPWAYTPLLVACAAIGLACLAPSKHGTPRLAGRVPGWLLVVSAGVLLQLVPLPAGVIVRISPATDAFLRSYQFSYIASVAGVPGAQSWHPLSLDPASTWLGLAFLVVLALFLAGLMRTLTSGHVHAIARTLIALGVVLAVVGIAQKALGAHEARLMKIYGFWTPEYFGNPFGPFVNRNHYAGWTLMVLPLALGYFAGVLEQALGTIGAGWRNRLLWLGSDRAGQSITVGFAVLVMAVALVYSGSRSGLACAAFAVAVIAWLAVRGQVGRSVRVLVSGLFLLLLVGGIAWAGSDLVFQRFTLVPAEIGDRLGAWRDALRVIRDFPLAGTGLNTYGTASVLYQTVASAWQYQQAHNDYLQLAAEGGLLLTVPAALAVAALIRLMRDRWQARLDDPLTRWLRAGAFVGIAAIALQSLVDFSLQIPANAALFVVVVAIAVHRPQGVAKRAGTHRASAAAA
jgi:putative inorganic carbon (HCO3(-)) transporter